MIFRIHEQFFRFEDVASDGHCLFNSFAKCRDHGALELFDDGPMLRRGMGHLVEANHRPELDLVFKAMHEDKETWMNHINSTEWGTELDIVVFSILFGVSVVSYSNLAGGFHFQSGRSMLKQYQFSDGVTVDQLIPASAPDFYVLHHMCGHPLLPSNNPSALNHYGILWELDDVSSDDERNAFTHSADVAVKRKLYELSSDSEDEELKSAGGKLKKTPKGSSAVANSKTASGPLDAFVTSVSKKKSSKKRKTSPKKTKPSKKKRKSEAAAAKKKEKKQIALSWDITANKKASKELNELVLKSNTDGLLEKQTGLLIQKKERLKRDIEDAVNKQNNAALVSKPFTGRDKELTWTQRTFVMFFYTHRRLGNKNMSLTCRAFNRRKPATIRSWFRTREARKWIPLIRRLTVDQVIAAIPNQSVKSHFQARRKAVSKYPLVLESKWLAAANIDDPKQRKIVATQPGRNNRAAVVSTGKGKSAALVSKGTKRLWLTPTGGKDDNTRKHFVVHAFVKKKVTTHWNRGNAITKSDLQDVVRTRFTRVSEQDTNFTVNALAELTEFRKTYLKAGDTNSLNTFLTRSLNAIGFTVRKITVSQKIPANWYALAKEGARRVRETMLAEDVEVFIAADEFFMRFNEQDDHVVAPRGIKRVGTALKRDEKLGCTAIAAMEMFSSRLLPPFMVFKGEFGKTLMKQWKEYNRSTVVFTSKHWMTSETSILFLKMLIALFPKKRIGLLWDKAPQHCAEDVEEWTNKYNRDHAKEGSKIVAEYIDPNLTSIHQPPDVVIIALIKRLIRKAYHQKIDEYLDDGTLKPGDKVAIRREDVVDFVEGAYNQINEGEKVERTLAAGFEKCGLNFRATSNQMFWDHLDSLNDDGIYKVLTETHTAMELSGTVPPKAMKRGNAKKSKSAKKSEKKSNE